MSKKKNTRRTSKNNFVNHRGILKLKFILIGTIAGVAIAGAAAAIVLSMNKSRIVHNKTDYHPATYAVAEKFMCGCRNCEMALKDCECADTDGGSYEVYFISEQLRKGLSQDTVVALVRKKFGNLKPEYVTQPE